MELLQYEFTTAPKGSYLGNIGELIKKIRYYRTNVPIEEFKAALPSLKLLEQRLQEFDDSIGLMKRYYVDEIMEELQQEAEVEGKLMVDIERFSKIIINTIFREEFVIKEFAFDFRIKEAVKWLEFYGYKSEQIIDERLNVVKDIFRSACSMHNIIFIDSTLT
ncbi:hypothetical protein SAMN04488128_105345 [Chitinophaga eiseniae]|uniref:Uncharacterized protein n=1 Tax=Chitinophaga eiseniae TaxID=634771 RepID=A0A1T4TKZ7_9BACT|nr:hypothetical protein [Chitinophaga eiseniae]SKA41136.1 hypothetical protein SAMN04488128_105345 [Chitinophaga eiseniae]